MQAAKGFASRLRMQHIFHNLLGDMFHTQNLSHPIQMNASPLYHTHFTSYVIHHTQAQHFGQMAVLPPPMILLLTNLPAADEIHRVALPYAKALEVFY